MYPTPRRLIALGALPRMGQIAILSLSNVPNFRYRLRSLREREVTKVPDVLSDEFMTLARLALDEKTQDVTLFLGKTARRFRQSDPEGCAKLSVLLRSATGRSSALRREPASPVPVDADTRLHLLRIEPPGDTLTPVLATGIEEQILGFIRERRSMTRLLESGLTPTRSALFVGPPGVGKTMTARWIAGQLEVPLLILDLSAVMSSFLGRTGNNVRTVLDYAKRHDCILLLDELDAIAKRRDDATEIGELKRLVTVLLQEIDEWPAANILLASTNHPELLDPAIWRRFDMLVEFPKPSREEVLRAVREFFGPEVSLDGEWIEILSIVLSELSYADIRKHVDRIRRTCILDEVPVADEVQRFVARRIKELPHAAKLVLADKLTAISGISQHMASEITGVSRVTIRKRRQQKQEQSGG